MHPNRQRIFTSFIFFAFFLISANALPLFPDNKLSCNPATWQDIVVFFLTNYVAHAATVPSPPGAGSWGTFAWSLISLPYPFAGLVRAAAILVNQCAFGEDDLGKAFSVGALAVVGRTTAWKPPSECSEMLVCDGDLPSLFLTDSGLPRRLNPEEIEAQGSPTVAVVVPRTPSVGSLMNTTAPMEPIFGQEKSFFKPVKDNYHIHGDHELPEGYHWVIPSPTLCFLLVSGLKDRGNTKIAQSQSLLKMAVSVGQLILSSITIYRARGSQLDRYGYAAFGLSVLPYAFMSLINLICVGCAGEYPYLFMLQTQTMQEAKGRAGTLICGEVGILRTRYNPLNNSGNHQPVWLWTVDDSNLLCVKVGNSETKRFKLVDSAEDATFVIQVNPLQNAVRISGPSSRRSRTLQLLIDLISRRNGFPPTNPFPRGNGLRLTNPFPRGNGLQLTNPFPSLGDLLQSSNLVFSRALNGLQLPVQFSRMSNTPQPADLFSRMLSTSQLGNQFLPDDLRKNLGRRFEQATVLQRIGLGFTVLIAFASPFVALVLPYALVSVLTGFQKGQSTGFERLVMLSWIIVNQMFMFPQAFLIYFPGFSFPSLNQTIQWCKKQGLAKIETYSSFFHLINIMAIIVFYVVGLVAPLAGFVLVGKMLKEFGSCSLS